MRVIYLFSLDPIHRRLSRACAMFLQRYWVSSFTLDIFRTPLGMRFERIQAGV